MIPTAPSENLSIATLVSSPLILDEPLRRPPRVDRRHLADDHAQLLESWTPPDIIIPPPAASASRNQGLSFLNDSSR